MSWFRVDDMSAFHKKVLKAGNAAWGALCRMGAHSAHYKLDGFVPAEVASVIASVEEVDRLLAAGFLERVEGGFHIHDYLEWNPSAAELAKLHKNRSRAGRMGGKSSAKTRAIAGAPVKALPPAPAEALASPLAPANLDHTRSKGSGSESEDLVPEIALEGGIRGDGSPASSEVRLRGVPAAYPIDPNAELTEEHRAIADSVGVRDVERAWIGFIGHHQSRGTLSCNFIGEWRKWCVTARNIEQRDRNREEQRGGPKKAQHIQAVPKGGSSWTPGKT